MAYQISENVKNKMAALTADEKVKKALEFIKDDRDIILDKQCELTLIPAPTHHEAEKAKRFVFRFIDVKKSVKKKDKDYKTMLQEVVQKVKGANLVYFTYEIPKTPGVFCAEVYINDVFVARSEASSKKQAQIDCAKLAIEDKQAIKNILKN